MIVQEFWEVWSKSKLIQSSDVKVKLIKNFIATLILEQRKHEAAAQYPSELIFEFLHYDEAVFSWKNE